MDSIIPILGAIVGGVIAGAAGISTALFMFNTQTRSCRRALAVSLMGEQFILANRLIYERNMLQRGTTSPRKSADALVAIRGRNTPERFVLRHVVGDLGLLDSKAVYHVMEAELSFSYLDDRRRDLQKLHYLEESASPEDLIKLLRGWDEVAKFLTVSLCYLAEEVGTLDDASRKTLFEFLPALIPNRDDPSLDPVVASWLKKAFTTGSAIDSAGWTGRAA